MSVVNVLMLKALWFQKRSEVFAWHFFQILLFIDPASTSIEPFKLLLCLNNLSCFERRLFLAILKLSPLASLAFRCFCDGFFFTGLPSSILASFSRDVLAVATCFALYLFLCGILGGLCFRKVFFGRNGVYGIPRRIRNGGIMPQEKNNTNFLPLFPSNPKQPRDKNVTFPSTDPMDVTFLMFFSARVQPPCRSTPLHGSFFFERRRREKLLFDCCWKL